MTSSLVQYAIDHGLDVSALAGAVWSVPSHDYGVGPAGIPVEGGLAPDEYHPIGRLEEAAATLRSQS